MIKYNELKVENLVFVKSGGDMWQGKVAAFNSREKEIGVSNGVQTFYYDSEDLQPIPVDDAMLLQMNFKKDINEDGSVKYMKGAFRILLPGQNDFSRYEIWYKDDIRHIMSPIYLHHLQNLYEDMTRVKLTTEAI